MEVFSVVEYLAKHGHKYKVDSRVYLPFPYGDYVEVTREMLIRAEELRELIRIDKKLNKESEHERTPKRTKTR